MASESTPLLNGSSHAEHHTALGTADQVASESAISLAVGDPNASAFGIPAPIAEENDEETAAEAEAEVVAAELAPIGNGVFVVLAGMWIGKQ